MAQIFYVAVVTMLKNSMGYLVDFPDLPGAFAEGKTFQDAYSRAREVLALHYFEHQGNLPAPMTMEEAKEKYPDAMLQMVFINTKIDAVKPVGVTKKTLTIPKWLNNIAQNHEINFSQILKNALIRNLRDLSNLTEFEKNMLEGDD